MTEIYPSLLCAQELAITNYKENFEMKKQVQEIKAALPENACAYHATFTVSGSSGRLLRNSYECFTAAARRPRCHRICWAM